MRGVSHSNRKDAATNVCRENVDAGAASVGSVFVPFFLDSHGLPGNVNVLSEPQKGKREVQSKPLCHKHTFEDEPWLVF